MLITKEMAVEKLTELAVENPDIVAACAYSEVYASEYASGQRCIIGAALSEWGVAEWFLEQLDALGQNIVGVKVLTALRERADVQIELDALRFMSGVQKAQDRELRWGYAVENPDEVYF